MKWEFAFVYILVTGLCACRQPAKTQAPPKLDDTLVYTYKSIKKGFGDCNGKTDSACTAADIKYPVFIGQNVLNDTVRSKLLSIFSFGDVQQKDTSLEELAQSVITSYKADTGSIHRGIPYSLGLTGIVRRQDSSLVVLEIGGYAFSGGAHGNTQTLFVNWDTRTGKQISLDDLFTDGYKTALNHIAEKIFRTEEKLSDTAPLDHYFFAKGVFGLNNNFMITASGLSFLYNEYEIKSYAEGQTTLFIPYTQIKSLLRPKTVVSQYLK
jgi:hypothetical protein